MTRRDAARITLSYAGLGRSAIATLKRQQDIRLVRLPDNAIQPQVAADASGAIHVVYYLGDPLGGDLFYSRSVDYGSTPSQPIPVNSPASAVAAGTIRGAQIAVGRNGRVHVAWNGSRKAEPKGPANPESGRPGEPMLYTRLNDAGTAFEPQRNLIRRSFGIDGGGSVAADRAGNVHVTWHGIAVEDSSPLEGEARRQVWLSSSSDDGKSFTEERLAWQRPTGACACCGMKLFADRQAKLWLLYRSATESIHRDIYLLTSSDNGSIFDGRLLHRWKINACPMSSMDFAQNAEVIVAAWETGGQVYWVRLANNDKQQPVAAPGSGKGRKHPRVALNREGELLLVWTEGTGWQRGGSMAWQLYDPSGQPSSQSGVAPGVLPWSFAAPVAHAGGAFSIVY